MLSSGIEHIYKYDYESQKNYLRVVCNTARGREYKILENLKAFYVPNEDYMLEHFGDDILHYKYDCYNYGSCKWTGHLVIPIRSIKGEVLGFTGYNPLVTINNYKDESLSKMSKYQESNRIAMAKDRNLLCPLGLKKAISDGYLVIVDGFFDCLALAEEDINSAALLGSEFGKYVQLILRFIDTIYILYDNDHAGVALKEQISKYHSKAFPIKQVKYKDIDEAIKKDREQLIPYFEEIRNNPQKSIYISLK